MEPKTKQSLLVTVVGVTLFVALLRLSDVLAFAAKLIDLILPILAGGILALFINVPMTGLEKRLNRLFGKAKKFGGVLRALEEPVRQIAINAGVDGSVVVENVKRSKKAGYGYDAKLDEYGVMTDRGIIDPTKVTRSALQNAASIAAMVLTTESLVCDIPAPEPAAPAPGAGGMGGMY